MSEKLPVAVIGAGPVGLAAAAHLALRHEQFLILERGPRPGYAIENWAHVRTFTLWRFNVDNGYEQVRSVVAALTGDFAAADRTELALPQTGVFISIQ